VTEQQLVALMHHCRLACEMAHPRFLWLGPGSMYTLVVAISSGYEPLELGLGGPVWHASTAAIGASQEYLRARTIHALSGVGDQAVQSEEWTGRTFHIRRRLTPGELQLAGIEGCLDVRGTPEGRQRLEAVRLWANPAVVQIADQESARPS
jgi:hypothetical protein